MSGSTLSATFPFPITLGVRPREGSKAVSVTVSWAAYYQTLLATINLLSQYQSGNFTTPQAVWVDNSTVPYAVALTCAEQAQTIRVPAFSQGMYPVVCGPAPVFTLTQMQYPISDADVPLPGGTTTLIFFNTPQVPYQYGSAAPSLWSWGQFAGGSAAAPVAMLPKLSVTGQYYQLFGFQLTLENTATWTTAGVAQAAIAAGTGIAQTVFNDAVNIAASQVAGVWYSKTLNFAVGVTNLVNSPINLSFSGPGSPTTFSGSWGLQYTIVLIQ